MTPERPGLAPRDVVPIMVAVNLARGATGTAAKVARLSAEIDFRDSLTGRPLLAGVITDVGERRFTEGLPITWAEVEPVMTSWALEFRRQLNEVQRR